MVKKKTQKQRRKDVKKYILNRPGEYISANIACKDFRVSHSTFAKDFKEVVKELGGTYDSKPGAGFLYIPKVQPPADKPAEKNQAASKPVGSELEQTVSMVADGIRVNSFKNAEGYTDPTAGKAIEKMAFSESNQKAGEVWEAELSNGLSEMVLIIKAFESFALCLKLVEKPANIPSYMHLISYMGKEYYVDLRRICNKPTRYINNKLFVTESETLDKILHDVAAIIYNDRLREKADAIIARALVEAEEIKADAKKDAEAVVEGSKEKTLQAEKALAEREKAVMERSSLLGEREAALKKREEAAGKSDVEIALLKQKVEIYERILFESGLLSAGK